MPNNMYGICMLSIFEPFFKQNKFSLMINIWNLVRLSKIKGSKWNLVHYEFVTLQLSVNITNCQHCFQSKENAMFKCFHIEFVTMLEMACK